MVGGSGGSDGRAGALGEVAADVGGVDRDLPGDRTAHQLLRGGMLGDDDAATTPPAPSLPHRDTPLVVNETGWNRLQA